MDNEIRNMARKRELEELRRRADEAERAAAALAARNAALESSSSWRMTAPLRAVITAVHRIRQWSARAAEADSRSGGRPEEERISDGSGDPLPRSRLPRRILIVAEVSIPQCLRYRVHQKADVLAAMGYPTTVVSWQDSARFRRELPAHGCVLFYRTPAMPDVVRLVRAAEAAGMMTFFEIDDLVFDVDEYARNSNLQSLPMGEREDLLRGAGLYRDMIARVDCTVASTRLIADRFIALGAAQALVVDNALDAILLEAAERSYPRTDSGAVTIIYGSGTDTHDADFELVAEPLARVMREHQHVRLVMAVPLRLPGALAS